MYFAGFDAHESHWAGVSGCGSGSGLGVGLKDSLVKNNVITEAPLRSVDFVLPVGGGGLDSLVGVAAGAVVADVVWVLEVADRPLSLLLPLSTGAGAADTADAPPTRLPPVAAGNTPYHPQPHTLCTNIVFGNKVRRATECTRRLRKIYLARV